MSSPHPYVHHTPGPDAARDMETLRVMFASLHAFINGMKISREKSLALTKLEETAMWANKAAVLSDPESKPE